MGLLGEGVFWFSQSLNCLAKEHASGKQPGYLQKILLSLRALYEKSDEGSCWISEAQAYLPNDVGGRQLQNAKMNSPTVRDRSYHDDVAGKLQRK